jgi:death-on-curing protein
MKEPVWLLKSAVIAAHSMMIARFGGLDGIRDEGLIDFALARLAHFYHYDRCTEVSRLAAA